MVKNCPKPLSPTDNWCFLGLAGYNKRFVEVFFSIASPLMALTQMQFMFEYLES